MQLCMASQNKGNSVAGRKFNCCTDYVEVFYILDDDNKR